MTKHRSEPSRWSNSEIEGDSAGYLSAQARHAEQLAESERERRERDDHQRFEEAFVAAGGKRSEALKAWQDRQRETASQAAARVADEAKLASQRRVRQTL